MNFLKNWLKDTRKTILLIGVISMVASLVYSFWYRIPPVVDAHAYDVIAMNIVQGHGFQEDATKPILFDQGIVRAGPGYEYFLAALYAIFGHRYEIVWIIQAILHGASAMLLFLICKKVFQEGGDRIGLIAAVVFGFSPDLVEISAMVMTETLYLFLTILVVYFFVESFYRIKENRLAIGLGASLGLAILFRPPVALFVPVILFLYAMRKAWKQAALFLIIFVAVLTPWTVRNYQIYHQFIPTTLIGSYNIWVNNTSVATGGQFSSESYNPFNDYGAIHGYGDIKQKATSEFIAFLTMHPLTFIKLCAIRTMRFFSLIRPMGFWFYQTGVGQIIFVVLSGLWIAFLFVTGFIGVLQSLREKKTLLKYLAIFALMSPLVLIPTVVQSRYRFQIYPFLAVFGACALTRIRPEWKTMKSSTFIVGGALLAVTLADILFSGSSVLAHLGSLFT